jgi:hypothetical protein
MDDARLTFQRFLERAGRSILRQGLQPLAAIRLAGRKQRPVVGVDEIEHRRHADGFCLAVGKLQGTGSIAATSGTAGTLALRARRCARRRAKRRRHHRRSRRARKLRKRRALCRRRRWRSYKRRPSRRPLANDRRRQRLLGPRSISRKPLIRPRASRRPRVTHLRRGRRTRRRKCRWCGRSSPKPSVPGCRIARASPLPGQFFSSPLER